MIKIISNNPLVEKNYQDVEFIEGLYLEVLYKVRDMIHQNYKLVTHPLAGSVKPNSNPYRTVIVKSATKLDNSSLMAIESAIELTKKMLSDKSLRDWEDSIKEDFQLVDKSLIDSAMHSLKNY